MDHLDTSWIKNEIKLSDIQQNYSKESICDIAMFYIYINTNLSIELITKDTEPVENNSINKERLLQIIQMKRHHNNKKYRLDDILSFQIDIEPENIQSFSELNDLDSISKTFLKSVPIFDEIQCIPSVFIFHDIHSLYFLFYEINNSPKSILKMNNKKTTKKVRICIDGKIYDESYGENGHLNKKRKSMKKI